MNSLSVGREGAGPRGCPLHFADPEARAQRGPAFAEGHGAGEVALGPEPTCAHSPR